MMFYNGVSRILQMCMHILFCFVCEFFFFGGGGLRSFPGSPHPSPPHKEKKAREVYTLRFVRTSSYATGMYYVSSEKDHLPLLLYDIHV